MFCFPSSSQSCLFSLGMGSGLTLFSSSTWKLLCLFPLTSAATNDKSTVTYLVSDEVSSFSDYFKHFFSFLLVLRCFIIYLCVAFFACILIGIHSLLELQVYSSSQILEILCYYYFLIMFHSYPFSPLLWEPNDISFRFLWGIDPTIFLRLSSFY